MRPRPMLHRIAALRPFRAWRALARSRRGVAAIEFALVLPFMLLLYFGMAEVSTGVSMDRKLTLLSRSLADLTGRTPTVTNAELDTIFGAATSVLHPYDTSDLGMAISSVVVRAQGGNNDAVRGEICWTERRGTGTPQRARGQTIEVPEGFRTPNTTYVLAEVRKGYKPTLGYALTGTLNLTEATPWPVRNVAEVIRTGVQACL